MPHALMHERLAGATVPPRASQLVGIEVVDWVSAGSATHNSGRDSAKLVEAQPIPPRHIGVIKSKASSIVGVISTGYGAEKVSYGLPVKRFRHRRLYRLPLAWLDKETRFWAFTPLILDHSVPLVHTFNEIPIIKRRFLASFESEFPRYLGSPSKWQLDLAFSRLVDDRCRKILAMSHAAAEQFRNQYEALGYQDLGAKVEVFRGGLSLGVRFDESIPMRGTGGIRLLFVGRHAFHKGIVPLVEAVERCNAAGIEVHLSVAGDFEERDYALGEFLPSADEWRQKLSTLPFVESLGLMSNNRLRAIMQKYDALVFPSLDESLGWVAVEAALEGLPVVSTNVFALPELVVHGVTGHLIPLRLGSDRRWRGLWLRGDELKHEIELAYEVITAEIVRFIEKLSSNRHLSVEMGAAARTHIEPMYSPERAATQLELLYEEALG